MTTFARIVTGSVVGSCSDEVKRPEMCAATYGTEDVNATIASRGTSLHRPFQIFIISGDFLLILLSYLAAGILYREFMGSPADQEVSIGAGLIVGVAFVTIAFFQGVYDSHSLLIGIRQSRDRSFTRMLALTTPGLAA